MVFVAVVSYPLRDVISPLFFSEIEMPRERRHEEEESSFLSLSALPSVSSMLSSLGPIPRQLEAVKCNQGLLNPRNLPLRLDG